MFSLVLVLSGLARATVYDGTCGSTAIESIESVQATASGITDILTCAQYASDQAALVSGYTGTYVSFSSTGKLNIIDCYCCSQPMLYILVVSVCQWRNLLVYR